MNTECREKRLEIKRAWRRSDTYKAICLHYQEEVNRLLSIGLGLLKSVHEVKDTLLEQVAVFEYGTGAIHRGYYCPSPVIDLIVGNLKRGRIVKKAPKAGYRYAFDAEGNMLFVDLLQQGDVEATEYLFMQNGNRYGITVNNDGELESICEEQFAQGELLRYNLATVYPEEDGYFCANLHVETYWRDAHGLKESTKAEYQPYIQNLDEYRCIFERANGFLRSYTCSELGMQEAEDSGLRYVIRMKRKA